MTLAFETPKPSLVGVQDIADTIAAAVLAKVLEQLPDPNINLSVSPQIKLDPVTVKMPAAQVDLGGFDDLAAEVKALRADIQKLVLAMGKPTTRTVTRDADGLIETITERRA